METPIAPAEFINGTNTEQSNLQEVEFEVEKILDFRTTDDGHKEYLLKWKGFQK